ncbi:60Kd inner membrane protein-domain-containing protein [Zopfochytrium polystomum]|nr:60Kd inner membrane protein-domain-containing protein [Zopfochytrium polystomum]
MGPPAFFRGIRQQLFAQANLPTRHRTKSSMARASLPSRSSIYSQTVIHCEGRGRGSFPIGTTSLVVRASQCFQPPSHFAGHRPSFSTVSASSTPAPPPPSPPSTSLLDSAAVSDLLGPIDLAAYVFSTLHEGLGPLVHAAIDPYASAWWMAVVIGTVAFRTALTLPLAVVQRRRMKRWLEVQGLIEGWASTLKEGEKRRSRMSMGGGGGAADGVEKKFRAKVRQLYSQHRCHPLQTFLLPWVQIPLFVTISLALRSMVAFPLPSLFGLIPAGTDPLVPLPGLSEGGVLWFVNLTQPDPTVLLPIMVGALNWANVEVNMSNIAKPTARQKALKLLFQSVALVTVPVATQVPAIIALYWVTSSGYSLLQNYLIRRFV